VAVGVCGGVAWLVVVAAACCPRRRAVALWRAAALGLVRVGRSFAAALRLPSAPGRQCATCLVANCEKMPCFLAFLLDFPTSLV